MTTDDEYQRWLLARRTEPPPDGLADRIMAAVEESALQPIAASQSASMKKTALQRVLPYLACSVAALVLAVRVYSVMSLFVVASSESEIVMNEPIEELPDVRKP